MSTLNYKNKISIKTRLIALLIMILFILATFIALYIAWTPINSNIIVGIQGRYFIPIVPALIFVFGNSILTNRHKFIEMLVRMILTISNFGMILVIYAYFYV